MTKSIASLAAVGIALALLCALAAAAPEPIGPDFRISEVGTDRDANRDALELATAYNPRADNYLVVWEADDLVNDDEVEIFGQLVSASGTKLGSELRISEAGTDGDANRDALKPAVAYNSNADEYLVTWQADDLPTDGEVEIFGQRLSATGAEVGADDFRISEAGTDGDPFRDGTEPGIAYNPTANEYLVSWRADDLATNEEFEIFGQLVNAKGEKLGSELRISSVGADADATREASDPAIAYDSTANEYLVSWIADDLATNSENEIFGQRLGATGAEVGADDFRISSVGADGDTSRDVFDPAIAYNSAVNEYLVSWQADDLPTDQEFEIFGQRLSAAGAEVGADDFRISDAGTDGDENRGAFESAIAYNPAANEYLVTWEADDLPTDEEFEIFGQRLSTTGAEVGTNDFRISEAGTDGDAERDAVEPVIAFNSVANEYLVSWRADDLATNGEFEVFGQRLGEPRVSPPMAGKCAGKRATLTGTAGPDRIKGTPKRDVIAALGGNDIVRSLGGNDLVCGGRGNDKLIGARGQDTLRGEDGTDTLFGGPERDKLIGGRGRDTLKGGPGKDTLAGGPGRDREDRRARV
jgi:Ca2+-binding RTX toxin-like protein